MRSRRAEPVEADVRRAFGVRTTFASRFQAELTAARPARPIRARLSLRGRRDRAPPLLIGCGTCGPAAHGGHSRSAAPLRAAPAPTRPRRRKAREGVPLIVIQRQLGHSDLGITSVYLQGIDSGEIIDTVHARRAPTIPVSASLRL
jgi:hypothetical protein